MKQAEKSTCLSAVARMKAGRWTIGNLTLMLTHCTRHGGPQQESIGQFERNSLASPKVYKGTIHAQ